MQLLAAHDAVLHGIANSMLLCTDPGQALQAIRGMPSYLEEALLRQRHHEQLAHFLRPRDVRGQVRVHVVVEVRPPVLPDALTHLRHKVPPTLTHRAHECLIVRCQTLSASTSSL